jgi:hypothetical protein
MYAAQEGKGPSREDDVVKLDRRIGKVEDRVMKIEISVAKLEFGVEWIFKKITEMQEDIRELREMAYANRR